MSLRPFMMAALGVCACHASTGFETSPADAPPAAVDAAPIETRDAALADATDGDAAPADGASTELPPPDPDLVDVAVTGTASASATWSEGPIFAPAKVIDGSRYDAPMGGNYWLLPNETPGWWQVDLRQTSTIELIRLLNCNNGEANDRGTKDFRLQIWDDLGQVVYATAGVLPFTSASSDANPTRPYEIRPDKPVTGRTVRVFVDSWYPTRTDPKWPFPVIDSGDPTNEGGGLNEVQVFARSSGIP